LNTSANQPLDTLDVLVPLAYGPDERSSLRRTLSNALIVTRREVRDSVRDWRIMGPILLLTFLFPFFAQFVAGRFSSYLEGFGAEILGDRTVPFLLMVVGFFPISISLVIALETFVGEKERRSLEPLLSTPLTNTELYIGKTLSAILPPLLASYAGMSVYLLFLMGAETVWKPPALLIVQIFLLTTVQGLVMITGAVVVSSQTTSTRAANLLASFIIIPVTVLIWIESAIMFLAPDAESAGGIGALWALIAGMMIVVLLLLRVGNSTFNREELLGKSLDSINLRAFFRRLWTGVRAVDESGTPARNLLEWYRRSIPLSIRRLGAALPITVAVFLLALIGGFIFGMVGPWQLNLPQGLSLDAAATSIDSYTGILFQGNAIVGIFMQNWRVLSLASALAVFTFGAGALILTPATYLILGFLISQIVLAGYSPAFIVPAVLTHGIIEIPVIVIATAAALKLGAVITRPSGNVTVGGAWSAALTDVVKLWLGVLLPGLLLAAMLEALVTPIVVAAFISA